MDCNKIQEIISLYLDNKLSPKEVIELENHFNVCKKCKQDYVILKNIKNILSLNKKKVSLNFTSLVMCKIKKYRFGNNNIISFGSIKKKIIMVAGFLFIVASSFFFVDINKSIINKQTIYQYDIATDDYELYDEDIDNYAEYEEYILSMLY